MCRLRQPVPAAAKAGFHLGWSQRWEIQSFGWKPARNLRTHWGRSWCTRRSYSWTHRFIPSAWQKAKIQVWHAGNYRIASTVRGYCSSIYRHRAQPVRYYIHALYKKITIMTQTLMDQLVISSLSRCNSSSWDMPLCRSFMDDSFGTAFERICRRCFFLQDLRRRSIPPTYIHKYFLFSLKK
jgi:hypothetical protein